MNTWKKVILDLHTDVDEYVYRLLLEGEYNTTSGWMKNYMLMSTTLNYDAAASQVECDTSFLVHFLFM